ncbi:MAG: ABC transporter ATP-binding protein, partial [Edaphobacter sp.]
MSSSFGPSRFGGGVKTADRPSRGVGKATAADLTAARPKPKLKKMMPEVWKLIKPRRWLLAGSFLLILLNRLC